MKQRILLGLIAWCLLASLLPIAREASAQGSYPTAENKYVNDYAGVIDPSDDRRLRDILGDLESETGIHAAILTIRSISDYAPDSTSLETFADGLFDAWQIGDPVADDGLLILVAVEDRLIRIHLGTEYGSRYDGRMERVIDDDMIPRFRDGNFSQGIYDGTISTITAIANGAFEVSGAESAAARSMVPASQPTSVPRSAPAPESSTTRSFPFWALIVGALILSVPGYIRWAKYRRYRPQPCPNCGTKMTRLPEDQDDLLLDDGQRLEEEFESVDYDVWQCPSCNEHKILTYNARFSNYSKCPNCNHRTLRSSATTVVAATYDSGGKKRVGQECLHCDYEKAHYITTPPRRRRDDSGDSYSYRSSRSSRSSRSRGGSSGKW